MPVRDRIKGPGIHSNFRAHPLSFVAENMNPSFSIPFRFGQIKLFNLDRQSLTFSRFGDEQSRGSEDPLLKKLSGNKQHQAHFIRRVYKNKVYTFFSQETLFRESSSQVPLPCDAFIFEAAYFQVPSNQINRFLRIIR